MAYKCCTATNWGKNFFTQREKNVSPFRSSGEVWVVGDNLYGDQWISKAAVLLRQKKK